MTKTVDVMIQVEPEAAAVLGDVRNREVIGCLVSRVLPQCRPVAHFCAPGV